MIDAIFVSDLLELMGGLIIAYTVIAVHHRILHEKKIDNTVFNIMKKEQFIASIGIALLVSGFVIKYTAVV